MENEKFGKIRKYKPTTSKKYSSYYNKEMLNFSFIDDDELLNSTDEFLSILKDFVDDNNCIVSGGYIRYLLNNKTQKYDGIDIYIKDPSILGDFIEENDDFIIEMDFISSYDCVKCYVDCGDNGHLIFIYNKIVKSIFDLISIFDVSYSMAFYHKRRIMYCRDIDNKVCQVCDTLTYRNGKEDRIENIKSNGYRIEYDEDIDMIFE